MIVCTWFAEKWSFYSWQTGISLLFNIGFQLCTICSIQDCRMLSFFHIPPGWCWRIEATFTAVITGYTSLPTNYSATFWLVCHCKKEQSWSQHHLTLGREAPWTSVQFNTGLTFRGKQSFTLIFTPFILYLESQITLTHMSLECGKKQSTHNIQTPHRKAWAGRWVQTLLELLG